MLAVNVEATERDKFLFLLAVTSGSADGWSFLRLGHAFVANMTGNTVLLGISIFGKDGNVLHPLVSLAAYGVGVAAGSFLTRHVKPGSIWSKSVSLTLLLETLLLFAAAVGWIKIHAAPSRAESLILLGCVATGIGLQSGALLPLRLPGIITTYITGTWTTFVSGLVLIDSSRVRVRPSKDSFEERLLLQAVFLMVYFLSAVVTGLVSEQTPRLLGGLPSIPVLLVVIWSAWIG
ncbi:MAG TPA: YoaK family protein [Candidatus Binataceae bacterium]|jgi:uncharacterized membrane protein YoaK (UPF0700 family)|nr:YoaK family protein [Candidatus Binataceae bacterium]